MYRQEPGKAPASNLGLSIGSTSHPVDTNVRTTVADLLVEAHPCCCDFHAKKSLESFRRLGVRKYGMWFDTVLDSPADELMPEDSRYIRGTWEQWLSGKNPFGIARYRVPA